MSVAAEHALRTLAEEMDKAADGMGAGQGFQIMRAMAVAHRATANRLQAEREDREGKLRENPSGFRYDKQGGKHGTR